MSKVFLFPLRLESPPATVRRAVATLWEAAGLSSCFAPHDLTAVKLHVGEPGTTTYVPPALVKELVVQVTRSGAEPFLTDTAVLYRSPRDNGPGHTRVAHEHGFTLDAVGAPFIPADGITGTEEVEVPVQGKHFERVSIASAIARARSLLVVSHATGHLGTGFGGALKNVGMGCSSRKAKLSQHHGQNPRISGKRCTVCGACAEWCPTDSITIGEKTAVIDDETCIGCGECIAVCREGAVEFGWGIAGQELQERIAEHAAGALVTKKGRAAFITAAYAITKDCDCMGIEQESVVPDIGLLASTDPVAIDQAVLDLVRERTGKTLESRTYPTREARFQIEHAAALGLGEAKAEIVSVEGRGR